MKIRDAGGASSVLAEQGRQSNGGRRAFLGTAFLLVAPTLLVCMLALECGLRLLGRYPSNTTEGIFEAHGASYRLRGAMTKRTWSPAFRYTVHTDPAGLRSRARGVRTYGSRPYDAFLGDSITFANGVEFDESFVGVYAREAEARGLDVANLAVGGHRFTDQEGVLEDFLSREARKPTRVVVVFTAYFVWGFEDEDRGLVVKGGYLFGRGGWRLPYLRVLLGEASSAYCLFRDGLRRLQSRAFGEAAATFPAPLQIFAREAPLHGPEVAARLEGRLDALDRRIRGAGASPVYVYMPNSVDMGAQEALVASGRSADGYDFGLYRALLERHAARAGLLFVDLSPTLRARKESGAPLSFVRDSHYEKGTHAVIARTLAREILGAESGPSAEAGRDARRLR